MDKFLDQAARILASEIPRREALKRLGGLAAGGILAMIGVDAALAASCPLPGGKTGTNTACPGPSPQPAPFCVTQGKCPCGTKKCDLKKDQCCPGIGTGNSFCAPQKEQCCGNESCKSNEVCGCNGTKCCKTNQACVNGKCVSSKS